MGSFIEDEIDAKILHGRIEKFFHNFGETVYLVNEEDIPSFKMGKNADEVSSFFNGGPGGGDDTGIHLRGNDMGKSGFSQSRRGMKKDVVERLPSFLGGLDGNLQRFHHLFLPDVFGKVTRPQIEIILNFLLDFFNPFLWIRLFLLFGFLHFPFLTCPADWKPLTLRVEAKSARGCPVNNLDRNL
jgi:hypothetical protein